MSDDAGVSSAKALSDNLQRPPCICGRTATGWYAEARPLRLQQEVRLSEADSFLRYVERFKEPGAVIFYSRPGRCFKAVLDYHEPVECGEAIARWCGHVVTYTMQFSRQYMEWIGHHRVPMTPGRLIDWINEHERDLEHKDANNVIPPLRAAGESAKWPGGLFTIRLPVINGDDNKSIITITVQIRTWGEPDKPPCARYTLHDVEHHIEEASARIRKRIEDESGVPVYAEH
jgi:hypothetical protein